MNMDGILYDLYTAMVNTLCLWTFELTHTLSSPSNHIQGSRVLEIYQLEAILWVATKGYGSDSPPRTGRHSPMVTNPTNWWVTEHSAFCFESGTGGSCFASWLVWPSLEQQEVNEDLVAMHVRVTMIRKITSSPLCFPSVESWLVGVRVQQGQ